MDKLDFFSLQYFQKDFERAGLIWKNPEGDL